MGRVRLPRALPTRWAYQVALSTEFLRGKMMAHFEATMLTRRRLLAGVAGTTALLAGKTIAKAQPKAAAVIPLRPARDRLEEAFARIADPKVKASARV